MTFNKECDYRWTCDPYQVKRHHVAGREEFSAWNGNRLIGYRDSLEEAEQACRFDLEEIN